MFTINSASPALIIESFNRISKDLFNNYKLQVNDNFYRFLDIEFYYHHENHLDEYTHKNELQKSSGQWYSHPSGLDITIGGEGAFGGILIRSIGLVSANGKKERYFLEKEVYGPLNVQREIFSNFHGPLLDKPNILRLVRVGDQDRQGGLMIEAPYVVQSSRIGLNPLTSESFHNSGYRFTIFPNLRHPRKGELAIAMRQQLGWDAIKINKELGSKFLS